MAALLIWHDHSLPPTRHQLFKALSTIGADEAADLKLNASGIDSIAAHISHRNGAYTLTSVGIKAKIYVQGKRIYSCALSGGEEIRIGSQTLFFEKEQPQRDSLVSYEVNRDLISYQRFLDFSRKLAHEKDISSLLNVLLDEVISLSKAEKGFLVLLNGKNSPMSIARHFGRNNSAEGMEDLSDSILQKVLSTHEAVVVSDALNDAEFSASASVINFRLSSVMCVPLNAQGRNLGAIYVANNSLAHIFDEQSLEILAAFASQAALILQSSIHVDQLSRQAEELKLSLRQAELGGIIGACPSIVRIFHAIESAAPTKDHLFILGESGTGKKLVTRELHRRSLSASKALINLNCASLPDDLMEIELFGCIRGAKKEATHTKVGKLHQAHDGILVLEEISCLPMFLQVKLLAALHSKRLSRVGENETQECSVRIFASDSKNVEQLVKNYLFHEGLYHLLGAIHIQLPPLSERGNDVLVLANYFLHRFTKLYSKQLFGLTEDAQNAMLNYYWPGNVRQLENKMRRAVIMASGNYITVKELEFGEHEFGEIMSLTNAVDRFRSRYVREALERNAGNRTKTAYELKVDPRTIFRYLESEKKASLRASNSRD